MTAESDTGPQPWEGECPYCDKKSGHLNNHVRQSKGDGHGPAGGYPDSWDKENHERRETAQQGPQNGSDDAPGQSVTGPGATEVHGADPDEVGDGQGEELASITFEGGETRIYECPDCEETVDYGAEECEEGHDQRWTA